jgi:alanine dehydrogenase
MLIGVPREIKDNEFRAGMVPDSVQELVRHGHQVIVQSGLGLGIGLNDEAYRAVGAIVAPDAAEVFARAELIVKVKEPQPQEIPMLRKDQVLFTYLHLAPDREQTMGLVKQGVTAIAYETVVGRDGGLPLLAPMSEVAGRLAVQAGAHCLERTFGGIGILLGGVTGVQPAKVVVIGGGMVGENAATMAVGMGARVVVLDTSLQRLRQLDNQFRGRVQCLFSNQATLEEQVLDAHLVIGAVLIPGASAPKLLTHAMIKRMQTGAVVVDVAIDQGGCFETSHPTTHSDPTFVVDGVVHYCVANMPGAVPRTSSFALNNATLPYVLKLAGIGWRRALRTDAGFLQGLNVHEGNVCVEAVARTHGLEYTRPEQIVELR